jgi:hypothetical protein
MGGHERRHEYRDTISRTIWICFELSTALTILCHNTHPRGHLRAF